MSKSPTSETTKRKTGRRSYKIVPYVSKTRHPETEELVKTLIDRRYAVGLTQPELGKLMGKSISMASIPSWETGRVFPSLISFVTWAKALKMKILLMEDDK